MENLTLNEIDLLLKGLDAIKQAESSGKMMSDLFMGILTKGESLIKDKENEQKSSEEMDKELDEKLEQEKIEQQVILIKAKLISIKIELQKQEYKAKIS